MKPFQYGGRRGMKELLAPRLIWDSSRQGPAGRFAKPFPSRSLKTKRPRGWLDSGGDGTRMTRRLRRYGGLRGIESIRAAQLQRLGEMIASTEIDEATRDLVKSANDFLQGNRLRVLNVAPWSFFPDAVETWAECFGWPEGT
jgi:hypothetical protein